MIFAAKGMKKGVEEISDGIGISETGSTMYAMREYAERNGVHAEGWRLGFDDLRFRKAPLILFLYGDHFAVLDSVGAGDRVYIQDPAEGRRVLARSELCEIWQGAALVFE